MRLKVGQTGLKNRLERSRPNQNLLLGLSCVYAGLRWVTFIQELRDNPLVLPLIPPSPSVTKSMASQVKITINK